MACREGGAGIGWEGENRGSNMTTEVPQARMVVEDRTKNETE